MPCYTRSERTQVLNGIKDINLLAEGLREMGFTVIVNVNYLQFAGTNRLTGMYEQGAYRDGRLLSGSGLDLEALQKYVAVANIKSEIAKKNEQLNKQKKKPWRLKKNGEFSYSIIKPKG